MSDPAYAYYTNPTGGGDPDREVRVSVIREEKEMREGSIARADRRFRTVTLLLLAVILGVNLAIFVAVLSRGSGSPGCCELGEQNKSISSGVANVPTSTFPTAPNWEFHKCASGSFLFNEEAVELNADHGTWPESGVCIAYLRSSFIDNATSYFLSATFMHTNSFYYGHPGLVYNYVNNYNYDFINIRSHTTTGECASYVGSKLIWLMGANDTGGYKEGSWNTLRAVVSDEKDTAEIILNGKKFADCPFRHPQVARGGVLVKNGYGNIFRFKDIIFEKL